MKIKHFNFPTFEEWIKMNYCYKSRLGEFDIEIEESSWYTDGRVTFGFAVAANQIPMNVYSHAIYRNTFTCRKTEIELLKEWYNSEIIKFKEFWEKYIISTYFIDMDCEYKQKCETNLKYSYALGCHNSLRCETDIQQPAGPYPCPYNMSENGECCLSIEEYVDCLECF